MSAITRKFALNLGFLAVIVSVTALLNGCKSAQSQQSPIKIDGSSTVFPITDAIAKEYQKTNPNKLQIQVAFSGTGGGFKKFCAGEIDIVNASRPIRTEEMQACNQAVVRYIELPVAFDALTVVVNPQNNWAKDITLAELKKLWEPTAQGKITRWKQVRDAWPDEPINLYGPGKDSGTFDYFTEATVGTAKASRADYTASENDNSLVAGISKDKNALGYFGLAYYEANQNQLKAIAIDSGKGPVLPSLKTVEKSQYQPLARPLFIYVNVLSTRKPGIYDFVDFYMRKAPSLVKEIGYVPLPAEGYHLAWVHYHRGKVGTVFDGKAEFNLTISELLRKQAKF